LTQNKIRLEYRHAPAKRYFTVESDLYQRAKIHPLVFGALAVGGGVAIAALVGAGKSRAKNGRKNHTENKQVSSRRVAELANSRAA